MNTFTKIIVSIVLFIVAALIIAALDNHLMPLKTICGLGVLLGLRAIWKSNKKSN